MAGFIIGRLYPLDRGKTPPHKKISYYAGGAYNMLTVCRAEVSEPPPFKKKRVLVYNSDIFYGETTDLDIWGVWSTFVAIIPRSTLTRSGITV